MPFSDQHRRQVTLLVRIVPLVAEETALRLRAVPQSICSSATCLGRRSISTSLICRCSRETSHLKKSKPLLSALQIVSKRKSLDPKLPKARPRDA